MQRGGLTCWYAWMVVCRIEAMAAITKSWAEISLLGKSEGFIVDRIFVAGI